MKKTKAPAKSKSDELKYFTLKHFEARRLAKQEKLKNPPTTQELDKTQHSLKSPKI